MSRVISTQGPGKERNYYLKVIAFLINKLMRMQEVNPETKDIASYIALLLKSIEETIEKTTQPWEKRGFWLKSDAFRRDWGWVNIKSNELKDAIINDDWNQVAAITGFIASKIKNVKYSQRIAANTKYKGAYNLLTNGKKLR